MRYYKENLYYDVVVEVLDQTKQKTEPTLIASFREHGQAYQFIKATEDYPEDRYNLLIYNTLDSLTCPSFNRNFYNKHYKNE